MVRYAVALSCALALTSTGCNNECTPDGEPPTLAIGTGETRFEALDAADPRMEIIFGPQGGYHVLVSLEATRLRVADTVQAAMRALHGEDELGLEDAAVRMRCNPSSGRLESWGAFLILDIEDPTALDGETLSVEVTVTDDAQTSVSDAVDVTVFYP